jgi:hypothetical protein
MQTYDCPPTLNDTQVLEFCKKGFLMLDGVVSAEINDRTMEYINAHPSPEPTGILKEDWFTQNVILQPDVAGAVRSLLGPNFYGPNLISNHRVQCPAGGQDWHRDGGSLTTPALHYLQVFYYPQACRPESGPTELLPGSHHVYTKAKYMAHYGQIRGTFYAAASAGSVFLTDYAIWHRRSASTANEIRNMLKYNYWRTTAPQRDWVKEPNFDPRLANYCMDRPIMREQFEDCNDNARMFYWLCGQEQSFHLMGGQGWPIPGNFIDGPHGYPGDATSMRNLS